MRAVWSLLVAISLALLSAAAPAAEQPRTLLTQDQFSQLTAISRDLQALKSATTTRREMFANARRELAGMRATIDRLLADGGNKLATPSEVPEAMPVFARLPGTVRDSPRLHSPTYGGKAPVVVLRLAAYSDQSQAEQGWMLLRTRNGDLLNGTEPVFVEVDLGEGRGQQTRIVVQIVPGGDVCRRLVARGEYCEPAL